MEPILGQIQLFPFGFAPEGWAGCTGQYLPIMDNEALYSVIGLTYGGDGRTNFRLPDLTDAKPVQGMWYCISMDGAYPRRS